MLRTLLIGLPVALVACTDEPVEAEPLPTEDPAYLVTGGVFTNDGLTGYGALVDEVTPSTTIDLETALTLPSGAVLAAPDVRDGTFFIGLAEEPVIQRYRVDDDGEPVLEEELSFANQGLQTAAGGRNPIQLVSETEAYLVDATSLQVIGFDPSTMTLSQEEPLSLEGLTEPDLSLGANFIDRDGSRLVMSTRYFREDGSAALLGKVAIIDTAAGEVTVDEETACANLATSVRDDDGNIYFASHSSQAARFSGGFAGDPAGEPCMVRMLAGANGFDDGYYVSLEDLTGVPAGFAIQGADNGAYLLGFDDVANPVTADNVARFTQLGVWEYYRVELTDSPSAMPVASFGTTSAYGIAFQTELDGEAMERPHPPVEVTLDDVAFLQFTSGSTRKPKGVMVTHRNLSHNAHNIMFDGLKATKDDRGVTWLPLFHDMGLIGFVISPLFAQVQVMFLPPMNFIRRPYLWLDAIDRFRGTITFALRQDRSQSLLCSCFTARAESA
ncbi:MAG: AMP-binding protein [Myxococcota bacterium]